MLLLSLPVELPLLYPDELPDEFTDELVDDDPLLAGLLYEGVEVLCLDEELVLLVRLPTLIPPLLVPVLGLAVLDGLPAELWLMLADPYDSVRARKPLYLFE